MKNLKLLSAFLFSFRGRINRRQWWAVRLFLILPALIGYYYYMEEFAWAYEWAEFLGILFLIFIAYIDLSICAKRYHDFDKTGWRQFVGLIPLIGELWISIECGFKEGNPDPNLTEDIWNPVSGAGIRFGTGGSDSMTDTNSVLSETFYQLKVSLP
jgi:uncharacterized membrane protein YhaH (DUF805 family)